MSPIKRTINRSNLVSKLLQSLGDSLKNQPEPAKKPRIESNFKVPEPKKAELSEVFWFSHRVLSRRLKFRKHKNPQIL